MEVVLAKPAGFCVGVERAYRIALDKAKQGKPVYILGLLVHNREVINKLERLGIKSIKDLSELPQNPSGFLIISAHGVSPEVLDKAKKSGLTVVDTTCPWVKKPQKLAKKLHDQGYHVVIVGDKNHTEVRGIKGWTEDEAQVVQSVKDVDEVKFHEKIGVVAQTTQSLENFEAIVQGLKSKAKELKAYNTICEATSKRQSSAIEVARKVDLMLVIGDRRSANTKRLKELCAKTGVETHQIQEASELTPEWLKDKKKVGVTAGASTPDWVIDKIVSSLKF